MNRFFQSNSPKSMEVSNVNYVGNGIALNAKDNIKGLLVKIKLIVKL